MRINLLEATEAEKNAVMAITDEESENFAVQARQAADAVESSRKKIEGIILQENHPQEIAILNKFNICWSQYRKLDETILDSCQPRTPILKPKKFLRRKALKKWQRFEESLNRLIHRNTSNNRCNKTVMLSYEALTAGLKIFTLHKPHIEEADDQEMDKIEQSIKIL